MRAPCDATQIGRFRSGIGEAGVEKILKVTIDTAVGMKAIRPQQLERVIVDTTVQEKTVAHPTDSRLLQVCRRTLVTTARQLGVRLKQTYAKEGKRLRWKAGRYGDARQFRRMRRAVGGQRTIVSPGVDICYRGKFKRLTKAQRKHLRRRPAIEPNIGHLGSDNRMDRCWLKGPTGDAIHAVLCAAGYNIRWLLRAVARLRLKVVFLRLVLEVLLRQIVAELGTKQRSTALWAGAGR